MYVCTVCIRIYSMYVRNILNTTDQLRRCQIYLYETFYHVYVWYVCMVCMYGMY